MGKALVIVESPAKAKTINKYLGKDFIVKSSVGHIRDLPTSGNAKPADPKERAAQAAITRKMAPDEKARYQARKKREQLVRRMGIDPDNGWQARYEILPGKEKVVSELKKLAKDSDAIYLATDLDREGEAIAWHLQEAIGGDTSRYHRVVFNEITEKAIQDAFKEPGVLDVARVHAQQARRFLDRVVGFEVSPLLWAKVARGLSAGRVQSVAVRLVVEREREIRAFVPEEYWEVHALLKAGDIDPVRFMVTHRGGAKFEPKTQADAEAALEVMRGAAFSVTDLESRKTSSKPSAPLITSTLQQAASTRLGFSVKKTMMLAQRLYEAGYITYMRTDSTNLSDDAVSACRNLIKKDFVPEYLPAEPIRYGSREGAQEAHEAIRPTDIGRAPQEISSYLDYDQQRLYDLIWKRTIASQMESAELDQTAIDISNASQSVMLRASGRVVAPSNLAVSAKTTSSIGRLMPWPITSVATITSSAPAWHSAICFARACAGILPKRHETRRPSVLSSPASASTMLRENATTHVSGRRAAARARSVGWAQRSGELQAPVGYDKWSYAYRDLQGSKLHNSVRIDGFGEPFGERARSPTERPRGGASS